MFLAELQSPGVAPGQSLHPRLHPIWMSQKRIDEGNKKSGDLLLCCFENCAPGPCIITIAACGCWAKATKWSGSGTKWRDQALSERAVTMLDASLGAASFSDPASVRFGGCYRLKKQVRVRTRIVRFRHRKSGWCQLSLQINTAHPHTVTMSALNRRYEGGPY